MEVPEVAAGGLDNADLVGPRVVPDRGISISIMSGNSEQMERQNDISARSSREGDQTYGFRLRYRIGSTLALKPSISDGALL